MVQVRIVDPPGRLEYVDLLRGLALFGMLAVHFQYYPAQHDDAVSSVISTVATGSFYPIFACLFGVGFALQFERGKDRPKFARLYARRLLALAGIAVATIALTGYSVLELYACWGVALLAVRGWSSRALVSLALLLVFAVPLFNAARFTWDNFGLSAEQSNARYRAQSNDGIAALIAYQQSRHEEQRIEKQGSFTALMLARFTRVVRMNRAFWFSSAYNVLPVFIVGVIAVRRKVLESPSANRRILWVVFGVAVCLAIAGQGLDKVVPNAPTFKMDPLGNRLYNVRISFLTAVLFLAENCWQGMAYATAFILLVSWSPWLRRLASPLACAGRMSLTNYVGQLAVLELMFAKIWLNVPVTPRWALVGTFALFGLQAMASRWWMTRFRYGPLEWMWRSLTYARWEPILISDNLEVV